MPVVQAFSCIFLHELFTQKNPPRIAAGLREGTGLLLPGALLVTIGLQALAALVLVHLQAAFLFQVAHGWEGGIWDSGFEIWSAGEFLGRT